MQRRSYTSTPSDGSRTITILAHETPVVDGMESSGSLGGSGLGPEEVSGPAVGMLRLRGVSRQNAQMVMWGEDVVNNEGCGKKKSKICCIFCKQRRFDESSSESGSDVHTTESPYVNTDTLMARMGNTTRAQTLIGMRTRDPRNRRGGRRGRVKVPHRRIADPIASQVGLES